MSQNSIHLAPHNIREAAKQAVHNASPKKNVHSVPGVTGIGIGDGHVKVTVTKRNIFHNQIPTEVNGIPVVIEEQPKIVHHFARSYATTSSSLPTITGGIQLDSISPTQQLNSTLFGVLVDGSGQKYVVDCSHAFGSLSRGQSIKYKNVPIATFVKSALACGQTSNHLDASIAQVLPGVQTDFKINGLGLPRGIAEPVVGQFGNMQGAVGGRRRGKINAVNYDFVDTYPELGNCQVKHQDLFQMEPGGLDGDSGSAVWNDTGFILGIHFAGSQNGSLGLQGNAKYITPELGVHFGSTSTSTTPLPIVPPTPLTPTISPGLLVLGGAVLVALLMFNK